MLRDRCRFMEIEIDQEFIEICSRIMNEKKSEEEWALLESSDMFQTKHFCGGYDATEMAFCFSYYDSKTDEFWFQVDLNEVSKILNKEIKYLEARPV